MNLSASKRFALGAVALFAIAFAWVESAIVFYLRTLVDRLEPYQPQPLPLVEGIIWVELVREAATMIMLGMAGILAGRTLVTRLGYALIAFGVWDIFYYVFLVPMTGWPNSLFDWDVLFLLPLPWWGPILAPVLIALLMITWGTLVTQVDSLHRIALSDWRPLALNLLGVFLALYVFMADGLRAAIRGDEALLEILPSSFNWPLFILALALMSAPVVQLWTALKGAGRSLQCETRSHPCVPQAGPAATGKRST
jgi:hypothetical protein